MLCKYSGYICSIHYCHVMPLEDVFDCCCTLHSISTLIVELVQVNESLFIEESGKTLQRFQVDGDVVKKSLRDPDKVRWSHVASMFDMYIVLYARVYLMIRKHLYLYVFLKVN